MGKKKKSAEDRAFEAAEKYANYKLEKGFYNKNQMIIGGGELVQFR